MKDKPRGIVLLEGADSAGKTTLARALVERYGAAYIHGGLYRDPWRWHVAAVRRAIRLAETGRLVAIDRNWLSHLVYGQVFNNQQYDVGARCLDRTLRRYGAVYVLCAPADSETQEARWHRDKGTGKREHFDRVREVIKLYADLRDGNLAHPGHGYLDQLIRFQDFADRDDVIVYDMDKHRSRQAMSSFMGRIIAKTRELREIAIPDVSGRLDIRRGGTLVVGAWENSPWPPACENERARNSTARFNLLFQDLALREDHFIFAEATPGLENLYELPIVRKVVAYGDTAADWLTFSGYSDYVFTPRLDSSVVPLAYFEKLRSSLS